MTVYCIMVPDRTKDNSLRSIIWDDLAGTVTGDHEHVPWIQSILQQSTPVYFNYPRTVRLEDPAHDPRDFWWLLYDAYWPMMSPPLNAGLPPVLRDVTPRPANPMPPEIPGRFY